MNAVKLGSLPCSMISYYFDDDDDHHHCHDSDSAGTRNPKRELTFHLMSQIPIIQARAHLKFNISKCIILKVRKYQSATAEIKLLQIHR